MRGFNDADLAIDRNRHPYLRGYHPANAFFDAQITRKAARLRSSGVVIEGHAIDRRVVAGLPGDELAFMVKQEGRPSAEVANQMVT
jgi:hypothetical protein